MTYFRFSGIIFISLPLEDWYEKPLTISLFILLSLILFTFYSIYHFIILASILSTHSILFIYFTCLHYVYFFVTTNSLYIRVKKSEYEAKPEGPCFFHHTKHNICPIRCVWKRQFRYAQFHHLIMMNLPKIDVLKAVRVRKFREKN